MSKRKAGRKANDTGRMAEKHVRDVFVDGLGFMEVYYSKWLLNERRKESPNSRTAIEDYSDRMLLRHVPYESIYNAVYNENLPEGVRRANSWTEFVIWDIESGRRLRLECKIQTSSGSVDEKLPYMVKNCYQFKEKEIIFLLDIPAATKGAVKWFKKEVAKYRRKKIYVFEDVKELRTWAFAEFR